MSTSPDIELERKRTAIREVYSDSQSWHDKVDKMSASQVTAIYLRFKREGRIRQ